MGTLRTDAPRKADGVLSADLAEEASIKKQLVHDLYERGRFAILIVLILCGVIRWALNPVFSGDGRIQGLFWLFVGVGLVRWIATLVPQRKWDDSASLTGQFFVFAAGVGLTSCTLAALLYLAWPQMDPARIAILSVITSGLISGAIMSLGFSPLVYMIYLVPPMGVLLFRALTDHRPPWGAEILATSFAIYALAVFVISLGQRRIRRETVTLGLRLSDLVVRDTLTSLHNRRFLHELMPQESARMARNTTDIEQAGRPTVNTAIALLMLDLDTFKQVNDTHGHAAGDAVLQQTAATLSAALRKSDNLVRWGGEEFVAEAWIKDPEDAQVLAEKLRRAVERVEYRLPDGQLLHKTVSIGYCVIPFLPDRPREFSWEQALDLSDAALYVAKAEGRNRWVGIASRPKAWEDVRAAFGETLRDLRQAEARGLVSLIRNRPQD